MAFDEGMWLTRLAELNSWASGHDPTSDEFEAARKRACLDRWKEGREKWNDWAKQMLALRQEAENGGYISPFGKHQNRSRLSTAYWQHSAADFGSYEFPEDADFSSFDFPGIVNFIEATFSGGNASFDRATFSGGNVSFDGSTFSGGNVSFDGATFSGGNAWFDRATFSGGEASFRWATFSGGDAWFDRATFSGGKRLVRQGDL